MKQAMNHAEMLANTYRNARAAADNAKRMKGWSNVRRAMTQTAWKVRKEIRAQQVAA